MNQFCGQNMQALLIALAARLTTPAARIALLCYYPTFSSQSLAPSDDQSRSLLELHGVTTASVITPATFNRLAVVPKIVANCLAFWNDSNTAFKASVAAVNAAVGRSACSFIPIPFTEANALWHPTLSSGNSPPSCPPKTRFPTSAEPPARYFTAMSCTCPSGSNAIAPP